MDVEELIDRLAKPIFNFRMSRNSPVKGAEIRKANALAEVERLILEYQKTKDN